MRARRLELSEIIGQLSDVEPWGVADSSKGGDVFVCALGFEPRCLAVPSLIANAQGRFSHAIKLKFSTNESENRKNEPALDLQLQAIAPIIHEMCIDRPEFTRELKEFLTARKTETERLSVVVDISVFANRSILRCMKAILDCDLQLTVAYSEAESYFPTQSEYEATRGDWRMDSVLGLERGVREVATSIDHQGYHLDPVPDLVILFPTFKPERSMAVISAVDPAILVAPSKRTIWIIGKPHLEENTWRLSAVREINGISEKEIAYEVSTFNYKDTLMVLEAIHIRYVNEMKLTVSPLGSKFQAIGTSLFCYMRPDVRVMFAIPKEYNASHFSAGARSIWKIQFGDIKQMTNLLNQVGSLELTA